MDMSIEATPLDSKACINCASGIEGGRCIQCPEFTIYDSQSRRCECMPDYTETKDAGCLSSSELQVVELFGVSGDAQQVIYRAIEREGRYGQNDGFGYRVG